MKKGDFTIICIGAILGFSLLFNYKSLVSIEKEAIEIKNHVYELDDAFNGIGKVNIGKELTFSKGAAWTCINSIDQLALYTQVSLILVWIMTLFFIVIRLFNYKFKTRTS